MLTEYYLTNLHYKFKNVILDGSISGDAIEAIARAVEITKGSYKEITLDLRTTIATEASGFYMQTETVIIGCIGTEANIEYVTLHELRHVEQWKCGDLYLKENYVYYKDENLFKRYMYGLLPSEEHIKVPHEVDANTYAIAMRSRTDQTNVIGNIIKMTREHMQKQFENEDWAA